MYASVWNPHYGPLRLVVGLSTRRSGFDSRSVQIRFMVQKVALGQVLSECDRLHFVLQLGTVRVYWKRDMFWGTYCDSAALYATYCNNNNNNNNNNILRFWYGSKTKRLYRFWRQDSKQNFRLPKTINFQFYNFVMCYRHSVIVKFRYLTKFTSTSITYRLRSVTCCHTSPTATQHKKCHVLPHITSSNRA